MFGFNQHIFSKRLYLGDLPRSAGVEKITLVMKFSKKVPTKQIFLTTISLKKDNITRTVINIRADVTVFKEDPIRDFFLETHLLQNDS